MPGPSIYRERWYAEEYDRDRFGRSFGGWLEASEVEIYRELLPGDAASILDVGAGTGKLTIPLAADCPHVVSADLSPEMLRVATRKGREEGRTMRPVVGDAQRLAFADRAFDAVVSSRMLMHLDDWRAGVAELCRVARRTVVLDFPPTGSVAWVDAWLKTIARTVAPAVRPYRCYRTADVIRELERQGFVVDATRRSFVLPVALHRRLDDVPRSLRLERGLARLGLARRLGAPVYVRARRADGG